MVFPPAVRCGMIASLEHTLHAAGTDSPEEQQGLFPMTEWTVVLAVRTDAVTRTQALETLCKGYWRPVYAWLRRSGHSQHDAEDLTQAFFVKMLTRQSMERAERERGRFRSYLLLMLKSFVMDEWDRSRAQRRGGGKQAFSLDVASEERREALQLADGESAERAFDRRWALQVLEQARSQLEEECEAAGKGAVFAALFAPGAESQADIAARLGLTPNAIKMAARRMRRRLEELIRLVVAQTVSSKAELDREIRYLVEAVSDGS
jgi:RNA polymerase sigma factor (sigma-70 family)